MRIKKILKNIFQKIVQKKIGWATVADGARSAKAQMRPVSAEADPATGAILSAEVELRVVLPATTKSPKRPAAFRLIRFGLQTE